MLKKLLLLTLFFLAFMLNFYTLVHGDEKSEESTKSARITINYQLAYPGILPDHPLYKIKRLRDKITPYFIGDVNKKIDYYLLQTDKGILASQMLIEKNKIDLAIDTALKAENNMTIITQVIKANKSKVAKDKFKKLETASLKHQEILNLILTKVKNDKKKPFVDVLYFSKKNLEEIKNTLFPAKKVTY